MTAIKAHFDGTNIALDEPAFLTFQTKLKILIDDEKAVHEQPDNGKPNDLLSIFGKPIDMGIEDFAEQHDHYLYGTPKQLMV
ncbi:MAG: hypothetical protein EPO24_01665 [Bacteroidetes bacterium]|nr:MAG: hypothetical protein EPO24_01665 [Bacteroidota bacterium]